MIVHLEPNDRIVLTYNAANTFEDEDGAKLDTIHLVHDVTYNKYAVVDSNFALLFLGSFVDASHAALSIISDIESSRNPNLNTDFT